VVAAVVAGSEDEAEDADLEEVEEAEGEDTGGDDVPGSDDGKHSMTRSRAPGAAKKEAGATTGAVASHTARTHACMIWPCFRDVVGVLGACAKCALARRRC
jgi:hypothetical protein